MNRKIALITLLVFVHLFASWCNAGSIWAKRGPNSKSIYSDDKATQIGDLLTIIITEESKVENKVKRQLEKKTARKLTFDNDDISIDAGIIDPLIPSLPSFGLEASSEKSLDGKSDYKDERSFEDKITVVVEDIHPDGNLVVIGTRHRDVGGDIQTVQVILRLIIQSEVSRSHNSNWLRSIRELRKITIIRDGWLKYLIFCGRCKEKFIT